MRPRGARLASAGGAGRWQAPWWGKEVGRVLDGLRSIGKEVYGPRTRERGPMNEMHPGAF